jgi:hypothetical protein
MAPHGEETSPSLYLANLSTNEDFGKGRWSWGLVAAGWVIAALARGVSLTPCTTPHSLADFAIALLRFALFLADFESIGGEGGELPSLVTLQASRGMAAAYAGTLDMLVFPVTPVSFFPALTLAKIFQLNSSEKTSDLSTSPKKEGLPFGLFWLI